MKLHKNQAKLSLSALTFSGWMFSIYISSPISDIMFHTLMSQLQLLKGIKQRRTDYCRVALE